MVKLLFLPTASEGWGKVMFLSVRIREGGTPRYTLSWPRYQPPPVRSGWGVPQGTSPSQGTSPQPGHDGRGYPKVPIPPLAKVPTPCQVRKGGVPQGTYPPWDRTAYGVLDTLRSVCLLRSRRRTFLFKNYVCTSF